jgi:hypothetical protein
MAGKQTTRRQIGREHLTDFVGSPFEPDVHARRIMSLTNGM